MTATDTRWREFDVKDCPPSAVADQIVPWDEVVAGDLVLWEGTLRLVEKRMLHVRRPDIMATFRLSGVGLWQSVRLDDLTGVRRYVEPATEAKHCETCKCSKKDIEARWDDAVDWLLNSRHTGDPDIQRAFWGIVDGKYTRDQADKL